MRETLDPRESAAGTGSTATSVAAAIETTAALTVARIPYLNAAPFYWGWDQLPGSSIDLVPRELGMEAEAGRVDAGLMAVADFFRLRDRFERVGNLGIACLGAVESVLLFSTTPLDELGGGRILLTSESSTSVQLCRVLLESHRGLSGLRYERRNSHELLASGKRPAAGEAWLLIGDAALAASRRMPDDLAMDLCQAWSKWTGYPFVFAVWAIRRSFPLEQRLDFWEFLELRLAEGEQQYPAIAARYAQELGGTLGDPESLRRYLQRFRYRLGPSEEKGLTLFEKRMKELSGDI